MSRPLAHGDTLAPGTRVPGYTFRGVIAGGGFGITYLAQDMTNGTEVAIKEYMPAGFAEREEDGTVWPISDDHEEDYAWGLDEFLKEARMLARFRHPSIVPVRKLFRSFGTAYFVMDYLEGQTLQSLLHNSRRPPRESWLTGLVGQILSGLEQVHGADYLHCDIKPGNIIIRRDGTPVLIDFGAAQVATADFSDAPRVVSKGYSPVEQYSGTRKDFGPWTDIYALGAVLYRSMTESVPIDSRRRLGNDPLVPVARAAKRRYGARLTEAVGWALMVDSGDRPQSIGEWREALEEPTDSARIPGDRITRSPEPQPARWKKVLFVLALVAALVFAAIGLWRA